MKTKNAALPAVFLERLALMFGEHTARELEKTFTLRPTSFRVNTLKTTRQEIIQACQREGLKIKPVLWYKEAFVLDNKSLRDLEKTEIYQTGKIYAQSLASMIPPLILDPQPGEKILDLTAAPGSKTSQIVALMERNGELLANDIDEIRLQKLQHNMQILGVDIDLPNWKFISHFGPGEKLCQEYQAYFDRILLDAPCGAEARFVLNNRKTYGFWQEKKIKDLAYTQRCLLLSAWSMLKPGGILVYSTCTFAPEENELQIDKFLEKVGDAQVVEISLPGVERLPIVREWKGKKISEEVQKALRLKPNKEMEGFFVVKMRKK